MSTTAAEKRSVHTDALDTLGTIIESGERDAIHLAVEPVMAGEKLHPGQDICIHNGAAHNVGMGKALGIVDPFLKGPVSKGERFWLIVYPRQITSLRHVWSHPDFAEVAPGLLPTKSLKEISEAWLREFIGQADCPSYETVIAHAIGEGGSHQWSDAHLHFDGMDAHGEIPDEFWDHVEAVTGYKAPNRAKYFSCGC